MAKYLKQQVAAAVGVINLTLLIGGIAWGGTVEGSRVAETLPEPAQVADKDDPDADTTGLPAASLDGVVSWTDQYFFHHLRIQAHVQSGECRLLDGEDRLVTQGTFDQCLRELNKLKRQQGLRPMSGKAVILLHGLAAPRWSMQMLARHLERHGGYVTFTIDYASLRAGVDHHAASLANVIRNLAGIEEINLVGHSLGNIVIRRYLAGNESSEHSWTADPRIARIVMIAPPNHGSITATRLSDLSAFHAIFGESGRQLGTGWEDLERRLAVPRGQFGIIAGGFGQSFGLNPFLPGDDDGRITVKTTRLEGAADFVVVPAVHELIANDPRVFEYTLRFLAEGHFVAADQRNPIRAEALAENPDSEVLMRRP